MGGAPPAPPVENTQPESGLEIWYADLAQDSARLRNVARAHDLLPPSEPGTADTPRLTAHAALRIVLAGHIGIAEARRPFRIAPGGKPTLAVSSPPLEFSLAHCETAALIAISYDGPVGVDLETPRPLRIADGRCAALIDAAIALAPETALPDGPGDARFLQAWTRLEALAKATGEGIGALLERLRRGEALVAEALPGSRALRVRDVTVRSASPYFAAVAGTSPSLATSVAAETISLPLDRKSLEQLLTGGARRHSQMNPAARPTPSSEFPKTTL
jgi:4'-phosphopantetheinyl transferase